MTPSQDRSEEAGPPGTTGIPPRGAPGFPETYLPVVDRPGIHQPPIFDPALKQFVRAFRAGEPVFDDPEAGRRWREARRRALDHVVRVVAGSPWRENLVLRGSLLLEAWVGEEAREPGDLDWVVVPPVVTMDSPLTAAMFTGIIAATVAGPAGDAVTFDPGDIAADDIWTYERVPGRRLVFTWRAGDLPPGTVQLDFTFNEPLPVPPEVALIPRAGGGEPTPILAASPELSLAWKLLWLATDDYPQGKDLYDAVLLAERVRLPRDLLDTVMRNDAFVTRQADALLDWEVLGRIGEPPSSRFGPETIRFPSVHWDTFRTEYPSVTGTAGDWLDRLTRALGPTFAQE